MMRRITLPLILLTALGCEDQVKKVVLHRSNCEVCHSPLNADAEPEGIEEAHPWLPLSCVTCHGGNDRICEGEITPGADGPECSGEWIYEKDRAHVSPQDGPTYLKNLPSNVLDDEVDRAYLRFVNPGDFRVLEDTCGACHPEAADIVPRSTMGHTAGEITVSRYRAGAQPHPRGIYGGAALVDPNPDPDDPCSVESLALYDPPPLDPGDEASITVAAAQDQYQVKSCMRCHLNDFGENRFTGDFRSSGCSACHMPYADDGLSRTADPRIDKQSVPHPEKHAMTTAPPINQCTKCHYRGGRIGISYQGYRESAGDGFNPPDPEVLGLGLHGHDPAYYLTNEDASMEWDATPADLHFEAGMHCVDCHTLDEVHGNGHLYADTQCAVNTECTDCHGSVREYATEDPRRPNFWKDEEGRFWLRTKITDLVLEVTQVKDTITPGHPAFTEQAAQSMGINDEDYSHTDNIECYTCHAGWYPSCYGCHVEVDLTRSKASQTTGVESPGRPNGSRRWVGINDLVLMWNSDGNMAPSMPAERFFMSVYARDDEASEEQGRKVLRPLYETKPRSFTWTEGPYAGETIAGFGQRAMNPHTTQRRSQFMACDRCHSVGSAEDPSNATLLDLTHGFGTQRFPEPGCDVSNEDDSCDRETDWTTYQLDAIQTREGKPLVVVGHPDPQESRPLNLEEIERMRAIVVPEGEGISTEVPADAATDPTWPRPMRLE